MASTQLSEKLGTNNQIFEHETPLKIKRSEFPLTHKTDFHLDAGMIVPITIMETLPNDTFEISIEYILKSFPMVVAPFTAYKIRTHWYYCKLQDLWRGALTLMTKGNSQNIELRVPTLDPYAIRQIGDQQTGFQITQATPQSLMSYLGLLPKYYGKPENDQWAQPYLSRGIINRGMEEITQVHKLPEYSALPFMMYQKIYRYAYTIPNLLQESKAWYPDDLTDGWRIDYAQNNLYNGFFKPTPWTSQQKAKADTESKFVEEPGVMGTSGFYAKASDDYIDLLEMRYGLWEEDRFTSAIPTELRGKEPTINIQGDTTLRIDQGQEVLIPSIPITGWEDSEGITGHLTSNLEGTSPRAVFNYVNEPAIHTGTGFMRTQAARGNAAGLTGTGTLENVKISLNQFRELISLTVWQERNQRIQAGDYNQFIYAHFKHNPKTDTHEPIYIGGSTDVVTFSDVVQTTPTNDSPLGNTAGNGGTRSKAEIGRFTCNDYGYIMGVIIIQPETIYTQGVDKLWTRLQQEDFYFPEDEGLGLEEILNRELYVSGNDSTDKDLFGWNERNTEYKTLSNKAKGFFALPFGEIDQENIGYRDLSAYSQARTFGETPKLSMKFAAMGPTTVRRDMLAAPSFPMFRCSFATKVRAVRPMSYKNVPQTFGF